MIKYISIMLGTLFMLGCSATTEEVSTKVNAPIVQESNTIKKEITKTVATPIVEESKTLTKKVKTLQKDPVLPAGYVEEKALKPLGSNVPLDCEEWSDGCNSCTRAGHHQASCTVNTCKNKGPFSCLRWQ